MNRAFTRVSPPTVLVFVAIVAVGVAVNDGFAFSLRTAPAVLLMSVGLAGVANRAGELSLESLGPAAKRWWLFALAAFLPYALVAAPASEPAAAAGSAFGALLEATAGALVLCAVAVTVLYGFARYGIHPGRPAPEERILDD